MFNLHIFSELKKLLNSILLIRSAIGLSPLSTGFVFFWGCKIEYNLTIDLKISDSYW